VLQVSNRLDQYLVDQELAETRSKAQALILAGKVCVNGEVVRKPAARISQQSQVQLKEEIPYVGRGGLKLAAAWDFFSSHLSALVQGGFAMDIGASTGGFTDCLLQKGFSQVYAVDVGYGQLAWKLRQDPRVKVLERKNIRHLEFSEIGQKADLIVIDVSFISILKFIERLPLFLKSKGLILALIKPQFEARREQVGKGGVIRDPQTLKQVVDYAIQKVQEKGFHCLGQFPSPVHGAKGNREVFGLFKANIL
jgi:23S rRNA (cytidine1920-2'-O)/16S rRNA (cytidine1409-2'-O)-methyltransferase